MAQRAPPRCQLDAPAGCRPPRARRRHHHRRRPGPGGDAARCSRSSSARARASFFCVGERVTRHPQLARDIVARGHCIENHSEQHLNRFALLGPSVGRRDRARAETILAATVTAARFFRAPAGLRNPFLEPVLARLGLDLVSWTRRGFDTVSARPRRACSRASRAARAGDILLLHDGHAARTAAGVPLILEVLPALVTALQQAPHARHAARGAAVSRGRVPGEGARASSSRWPASRTAVRGASPGTLRAGSCRRSGASRRSCARDSSPAARASSIWAAGRDCWPRGCSPRR